MDEQYGLSYPGLTQHYFDCQCSDFNHVFRFVFDEKDGDMWLEVQLNHWLPWHKRVWQAIRYLFAKRQAYGHFDTTMLREEDVARLQALLTRSSLFKQQQAASRKPTE